MLFKLTIVLAVLAKLFSACPFSETGNLADKDLAHAGEIFRRRLALADAAPSCLTRASPVNPTKAGICSVYNGLQNDLTNTILPSMDTNLKLGNFFGKVVRLVFHDAGEVDVTNDNDTMGPDGCLSSDPGSNGLDEADSLITTLIEPLWQNYCDYISRADFWVLLSHLVIEAAEPTDYIKLPFQYGRVDAVGTCEAGTGRLPDSGRGMAAIEDTFVTQMGLTLDDAAALIGGHSVGHVHVENSGFFMEGDLTADDGLNSGWDTTPHVFDNLFYRQLLTFNWHNILNPAGDRGEWKRNPQHQYAIMLNTDMALAYDLDVTDLKGTQGQVCGPFGTSDSHFGCYPSSVAMPPTCNAACRFANSNTEWLDHFAQSWTKMTNVGYGGVPDNTDGATVTGKLGTLTTIDLSTC